MFYVRVCFKKLPVDKKPSHVKYKIIHDLIADEVAYTFPDHAMEAIQSFFPKN